MEKPPFVLFHDFYYSFSSSGRRLFWILFIALIIAVFAGIIGFYLPDLGVTISETPDYHEETIPVKSFEYGYRSMDLYAKVFQVYCTRVAGMIQPLLWLYWFWAVFLVLGWSAVLAASSRINSWVAYLVWAVYGCYVYAQHIPKYLWSTDPFYLITLAWILSMLIPAYLFYARTFNWSLFAQFSLFAGIQLLQYIIVGISGGIPAIHHAITSPLWIFAAITFLFIVFTSKDLANLIVYLCTNRRETTNRKSVGFIVGIFGILLFFLVWLLLNDIGKLPYGLGSIEWIHFWAIAAIITVFTTQNMYSGVKDWIQANLAFSILILGVGIIAAAFIAGSLLSGEYLMISFLRRLVLTAYTVTTFMYLIYLLVNFWPLLKAKVAVYYLLMFPNRFRFVAVWFTVFGTLIFVQGNHHWRDYYILNAVSWNFRGDNSLIEGDDLDAKACYLQARMSANGDVKSNFNIAALLVRENGNLNQIFNYDEAACSFTEFIPARLNQANLLLALGKPAEALRVCRLVKSPTSDILLSQAAAFAQLNVLDSAIISLKQAIQNAPKNPTGYVNLAYIYLTQKRPDVATQVLTAASQNAELSPFLLTQLYSFNLANPSYAISLKSIHTENLPYSKEFYWTRYHESLNAYVANHFSQSSQICDSLLVIEQVPEVLWLKMNLTASQDSFVNLVSRTKYLLSQYPEESTLTNQAAGIHYFRKGMPEVARLYLTEAARNDKSGEFAFQAACAEIDAMRADSGILHLNLVRALHSGFYKRVAKESAITLRANGQTELAILDWNFADAKPSEFLRTARIARQMNNLPAAISVLSQLAEQDSHTTLPYLEAGRFLLARKDTTALENIKAGLIRNPKDHLLNLDLIRALILLGKNEEASQAFQQIKPTSTLDEDYLRLKADVFLMQGDTGDAMKILLPMYIRNKLDTELNIQLAEIFYATQKWQEGYRLAYDYTEINEQNPTLWLWFARFSKAQWINREAGFGALKAIETSLNPAFKQQVKKEFAEEIKIFQSQETE
ncbi:MAG: tetratricopeptide repeat protein [Bacteroidia bacterium]|nr:tetratricopeptide repeat protein [Bacteroidia bacterium]